MTLDINNYKVILPKAYKSNMPLKNVVDSIEFRIGDKVIRYNAQDRYLSHVGGCNDKIFKELNVDKYDFCERAYGYEPNEGMFPECPKNSITSLIAVTFALFQACESYCKPVKEINLNNVVKNSFLDTVEQEKSCKNRQIYKFAKDDDFLEDLLFDDAVPHLEEPHPINGPDLDAIPF